MVGRTGRKIEAWSSRLSFLLASIGAAVGLGNFWKFPYMAGQNGGGAFVLVYLGCILLIVVPLVIAETLIGRRGKASAVGSARNVAVSEGLSARWSVIGWLGMIGVFLVLTFYSVIGGWVIAYVGEAANGNFIGADPTAIKQSFNALLAEPGHLMRLNALFMTLTVLIVIPGLAKGIEPAINVLMPALFVMLLGLTIYAGFTADFARGVDFLFVPDFAKIDANVVLGAIGQAFFSVGVGLAILITYGAYLPREINIMRASTIIALSDTVVALLAALLIFPIVFAYGLEPGQGPTLIFVTLPNAFSTMPGGQTVATVFFILLFVAAVSSSIAMVEIVVSWASEALRIPRAASASLTGVLAWLLGIGTVYSFNEWADFHPLGMIARFEDSTVFDLLDYLTSYIMLPLGGILVALFVGWRLPAKTTREELGLTGETWFLLWRLLLRYLVPIAIGGVMIANLVFGITG